MFNELRILLTDACTHSCRFCHNEWQDSTTTYLDLELAVVVVREAYNANVRHFSISGGEPFMHPGVRSFLARFREAAPDAGISIASNGLLCGHEELAAARSCGAKLRFNLPTVDPRAYSHATACGGLSTVLENIERASSMAFPIGLNTVWIGQSVVEIAALISFAASIGADVKFLAWDDGEHSRPVVPLGALLLWLDARAVSCSRGDSIQEFAIRMEDRVVRTRLVTSPCWLADMTACRHYGELRLAATGELVSCHRRSGVDVARMTAAEIRDEMHRLFLGYESCPVPGMTP